MTQLLGRNLVPGNQQLPVEGEQLEMSAEGNSHEDNVDPFAREAVTIYLKCGSLARVARELGTTVYELQKLAKSQWWTDEIRLQRSVEQAELDSTLTNVLGSALARVAERLEQGELMIDKLGNEHWIPVSASALTKLIAVVFDKRQLIRGLPTAVTNESSKLSELAEKLEELGRATAARTLEMGEAGATDIQDA
jgi:hypothetical protein